MAVTGLGGAMANPNRAECSGSAEKASAPGGGLISMSGSLGSLLFGLVFALAVVTMGCRPEPEPPPGGKGARGGNTLNFFKTRAALLRGGF